MARGIKETRYSTEVGEGFGCIEVHLKLTAIGLIGFMLMVVKLDNIRYGSRQRVGEISVAKGCLVLDSWLKSSDWVGGRWACIARIRPEPPLTTSMMCRWVWRYGFPYGGVGMMRDSSDLRGNKKRVAGPRMRAYYRYNWTYSSKGPIEPVSKIGEHRDVPDHHGGRLHED
ncbi:hypothetical protein Tco_1547075 [Tanacetum coccineum]